MQAWRRPVSCWACGLWVGGRGFGWVYDWTAGASPNVLHACPSHAHDPPHATRPSTTCSQAAHALHTHTRTGRAAPPCRHSHQRIMRRRPRPPSSSSSSSSSSPLLALLLLGLTTTATTTTTPTPAFHRVPSSSSSFLRSSSSRHVFQQQQPHSKASSTRSKPACVPLLRLLRLAAASPTTSSPPPPDLAQALAERPWRTGLEPAQDVDMVPIPPECIEVLYLLPPTHTHHTLVPNHPPCCTKLQDLPTHPPTHPPTHCKSTTKGHHPHRPGRHPLPERRRPHPRGGFSFPSVCLPPTHLSNQSIYPPTHPPTHPPTQQIWALV